MSKVAFSFNQDSGSLTMVLNNQPVVVSSSHRFFTRIKKALVDGKSADVILKLVNDANITPANIKQVSNNRVEIINGKVCLDGKELHNCIVSRIYDFMRDDLPFEHLLLFIDNIMKNTSFRVQNELFKFLEHQNLPITPDGCFYAYKAVKKNGYDIHSGTILNAVGATISMDRSKVDDDYKKGCSKGLHCGTIEYASSYGGSSSVSKLLIVKVNPKDVVSVPDDCSWQKVRTCKYYVHSECKQALTAPMHDDKALPCSNTNYVDDVNWDDVEDLDDNVDINDVQVSYSPVVQTVAYHNKRDSKGRFAK